MLFQSIGDHLSLSDLNKAERFWGKGRENGRYWRSEIPIGRGAKPTS